MSKISQPAKSSWSKPLIIIGLSLMIMWLGSTLFFSISWWLYTTSGVILSGSLITAGLIIEWITRKRTI